MKKMLRWNVPLVVVLALVAAAPLVWARTRSEGQAESGVNKHRLVWTTRSASTTSTSFTAVPGLSGISSVVSKGVVVATVSGTFRGGPVELRFINDSGRTLRPGRAHIDPTQGTTFFTLSFGTGGSGGLVCHIYDLLWRSPSGEKVSLKRGSVVLTYFYKVPKGATAIPGFCGA
jgi:hypothetical protein